MKDDLNTIPGISATRDGDGGISSTDLPRRSKDVSSMGTFPRLLLTTAFVVAAVACAWAWQLQLEIDKYASMLERYSVRTGDLEDLLSDTDETVNQSAAAMRVQLKRLDTENRKLWDARKVSNRKISELEKKSKFQAEEIVSLTKSANKSEQQLPILKAEISRFSTLAKDLTNLAASAKQNQTELERVADGVNRIDLEQAKLGRRVDENEGWVESINAWRPQVNGKITQIEANIRESYNTEVQTNSD